MPGSDDQPELVTAVTEISERMSLLIREEIELAKAEMTQKATRAGKGAAAVAAGSVFGVFAIVFLLLTIAWGLNSLISSLWIGFAIVLVILIICAIVAFLLARRAFQIGPAAPTMAIDEAKRIRETVTAKSGPPG